MPIVLRHNETLDLNLCTYSGAVSVNELNAIADYGMRCPDSLQRDCLNVVQPGTNFDAISYGDLDALFGRYIQLFARLQLHLFRRAAWVCHSPCVDGHIAYWLGGDTRTGMLSLVRQFPSIAEAGDWLVLNPDECAFAERGEGFGELASFNMPALTLVKGSVARA